MKKLTTMRNALWLMLAALIAMTPMAVCAADNAPAKAEAKTSTVKANDTQTTSTKKAHKKGKKGKKGGKKVKKGGKAKATPTPAA
jgi:hypothetical protein